ncbi:ABC transporter permease [Ignavigranum ruoffiae]|uniref:Carbohydrate ABC transporter membrane protein 1, CUT1 family n=1 Tax=Ignavigranum ruoffiae TaxID=89093 RepID=A0A1H9FDT1_9LACT|nr:ABC transporter permease subunit [Ignavigranum ruoffiae]UPQ86576.1 ABC transporter permease subunit [Ignavigranum ruoffiae]SEQ36101.1 carbohydrate ABC transporter membrane protein 1, CUT1 family [Ignavigranum ruoffiae]
MQREKNQWLSLGNLLPKQKVESSQTPDPNFKPHRRSFKQVWRKYRVFYLMLLPALIFFLVFSYWPMTGILIAFRKFTFTSGMYGKDWVGLKYFQAFFKNREAWMYVRNTLVISAIKLFIYLPFPIALALIFNETRRPKLRSFYQSISYLPYFISWVVVIGILNRLFAPNTGLINLALKALKINDGSTFWMMENAFFYPAVFFSYLWKNIGWDSIIYFAAIMGISPSLYEAAAIDGASRWKQTLNITLPSIRGTIMILFILSLGGILTAGFDQIYLMQNPGNFTVSETIDTYIVKTGLEQAKYGPAAAVGLMQGVVGLVLTLIVNKLADKYGDNAVW